jgi:hypothetical protein
MSPTVSKQINKKLLDTRLISATPEIIRKPASSTSQSVIMAVYRIGLWTDYGKKKHIKKLPVRT